jgi:hypothetical protein
MTDDQLKDYIEKHTFWVYRDAGGKWCVTQFRLNPQQTYFEVIATSWQDALKTIVEEKGE